MRNTDKITQTAQGRLGTDLLVVDVLPESVEDGLEDLRPPGHDGVLDDAPVPPVPSLEKLPILPSFSTEQ